MSSPSLPASVKTIILSGTGQYVLITFSCFNAPGSALYPFSAFTCRGKLKTIRDNRQTFPAETLYAVCFRHCRNRQDG